MPIVTVFGGSGFIGRYAVRKLAKLGWRVRVAVRRPNEAMFLRTAGDVGQVETIQANIRDDASTERAIAGSDAVVNLVGILFPRGKQTFDAVQRDGAERIARFCAVHGVERLVHISAIGASAESQVAYQRTKAEAEEAMRRHVPTATVLRPSLVFGPEDEFFNRFAGMARMSPILPLIGGDTRFQPVYVGDVAEAIVRALDSADARGKTYELGGPETLTMRGIYELIMEETGRKRAVLPVPGWLARIQATVLELPSKIGLPPLLTRDQVAMLDEDNVVSEDSATLQDLGVKPTTLDSILPTYLYRYRASGQYARTRITR